MLLEVASDGREQAIEIGDGVSGNLLLETAPDEQSPFRRCLMVDTFLAEVFGLDNPADI